MFKATDNGNLIANGENRTGLFRFCGRGKIFNGFPFLSPLSAACSESEHCSPAFSPWKHRPPKKKYS